MKLLDEQHRAFIQSAVSISAAARLGGAPALARAHGCAVRGARVRLLFSAPKARALLEALPAAGLIAVGFNEPSTHRSIQLKGDDARIVPGEPGDEVLSTRYVAAFVEEVKPLGYPEDWTRTLFFTPPGLLVAVEFTPARAFGQTPGPRAGEPLRMR